MAITFRPGVVEDGLATLRIHLYAVTDLSKRQGNPDVQYPPTEEEIVQTWERLRPLYEHLTRTAEHLWVAEQDGEIVAYARSSNYGGVRQLNELFVHPEMQAQGVGKQLLARAFPVGCPGDGVRLRLILAAPNIHAQSLYMRSGVYARGLVYRFSAMLTPVEWRALQERDLQTDLCIEAAPAAGALPIFAEVDRQIVGFQRDNDHHWLLTDRQAWLYRRQGQVVGYGYTGESNGPFALLNPADFPAVLAHAEQQAAANRRAEVAFWPHSTNRHALDYLVACGYKAASFTIALMSDVPFGRLEQYINTDTPFML